MTKRTVAGLAAGAAVAGGAAAVHTVRQARRERIAVSRRALTGNLEHTPDRETAVRTDDGVTLHVEIDEPEQARADAPVVVLVHGFTVSSRAWVFQRRALTEAGYRVVSYDHRGHGRSGHSSMEGATIEQLARDLRLVLDEVVDQIAPGAPLVLVGHSMGGMTLMAFGDLFPELIASRIVGVCFMATSAGGEGHLISLGYGALVGRLIERYGPGALDGLSRQERLLRSLRRVGRDLEDYFVEHYSFASPVSQTLVRFTGDLAFETSFLTIGAFIATFNEHDRRDALKVWGAVPSVVITAHDDRLTPLQHGRRIADSIPGSEHVIVADAGHMVMLEHPELVSREILELIDLATRSAG
ncbi:alpha/beta fold hydrolase [Nostocoides sp. F2B08]|uniref:alpha/beta fold hydrolase n=1 Tax=Nostocoides sp. F2B08 TaxID=2653936 RepID=UPI001262F975|nr:alpha/beta hydrolase [Tetrasphaera sp. F2B08]KAB7743575.1 alpha/beta fold hydrolase [Tetrasphaera sp. F2B08]